MDASEGRADAADSARDSRECRICHAGAEDGPLSQPCGCRGSASWVHRACLERWRRSSTRRDAAYRCGTCKVEFRDELSLELLRARLDAQRERGSAGALHSMSRLAVELQAQGRLAEAEPLLREALEVCRATRGASHSDTLLSTTRLAALLQDRGELAQVPSIPSPVAAAFAASALTATTLAGGAALPRGARGELRGARHEARDLPRRDERPRLPSPRPRQAEPGARTHARSLARPVASLCSPAPPSRSKAEPLYRECLAARRRLLGPRHPDTLVSLSNLGTLLRSLGRLEEAAPLQEAALQLARETLGRRHSDTLAYLSNLGLLRLAQGRLGEAEGLCREAAEESRATQGLQHPETAASMSNLAALLKAQGRLDEAQPATQPPPRLSVAAFFTPPARAPSGGGALPRRAREPPRAARGVPPVGASVRQLAQRAASRAWEGRGCGGAADAPRGSSAWEGRGCGGAADAPRGEVAPPRRPPPFDATLRQQRGRSACGRRHAGGGGRRLCGLLGCKHGCNER